MHDHSILTVGRLIEFLEGYPVDTKVRVAHQPTWPIALQIANVTVRPLTEDEDAVWIATIQANRYEESQYAPRDAWDDEPADDDQ